MNLLKNIFLRVVGFAEDYSFKGPLRVGLSKNRFPEPYRRGFLLKNIFEGSPLRSSVDFSKTLSFLKDTFSKCK